MTIRTRLLCLLFILAALFLAGALVLRASEYQRVRQIAEADHREKTRFFTKIMALKEVSLEELAYDDTYWDEMVQFVSSRDPQWAAQNLDPALPTHMIDGIWIYSPRMALVYGTCSRGHDALKQLPLPAEALARAYAGHHFFHFFLPTRQGVLEIRGAEIHATNDEKRTGRSFGLFLSGRLWDADYLKTLSDLTASRASLRLLQPGDAMTAPGDDSDDMTSLYRPCRAGEGRWSRACILPARAGASVFSGPQAPIRWRSSWHSSSSSWCCCPFVSCSGSAARCSRSRGHCRHTTCRASERCRRIRRSSARWPV